MNPFANLTLPVNRHSFSGIAPQQLKAFLEAPSETTAAGLRDRALLQLLAHGIQLRQLHFMDLKHINREAKLIILSTQSRERKFILLNESPWANLQRWLAIRDLFAMNTEAVFISLHWTAGRSQPGSRLSERGMRAIVKKYLEQIGIRRSGINSRCITRSATSPPARVSHHLGETT